LRFSLLIGITLDRIIDERKSLRVSSVGAVTALEPAIEEAQKRAEETGLEPKRRE
jgi:hypothetical protein